MLLSDTDNSLEPLKNHQTAYKSRLQISLMCWTIATPMLFYGYWMVYIQQINIETLKELFSIDLQSGVATGLLNGCIPIGGLVGALLNRILVTKISRRKSLLLMNLLAIIIGGAIFIRSFYVLLICRFLQGFCVGNYSSIIPPMIRQLSPKGIAGSLGSFVQLNVCLGGTIGYLFCYILQKITEDKSGEFYWYYIFGLPEVFIAIHSFILIFIYDVETPKYWLSVGKVNDARQLIARIYKSEYVQQVLQQKIQDLQSLQNKNKSQEPMPQTKISKSYQRFQIMIAVHLGLLFQFSGINAVVVYCGKIAKASVDGELVSIMPILINLDQIIGLLISSVLLMRIGRRQILLFGISVLAISSCAILIGFQLDLNELILLGLFVYMIAFGLSLGSVVWLYVSQIVQPKYMFYAIGSNWIAAACVVILFPILTDDLLQGNPALLFAFFMAWCSVSFILCYFCLIETKDKTQKQIKEGYQSQKNK